MAKRLFSTSKFPPRNPNPNPSDSATPTILSLFNCKRRKKLKKKLSSPRVAPIQKSQTLILPQFESILHLDSHLRFLIRTASFLCRRGGLHHHLPLPAAGKLHQELGFPRGRKVRKTFKFPIPHGKSLSLDEDDERKMNSLSTLPLISPYSDGSKFNLWSVEAEKYRVGVIHEFLSLTLEKRAMIHHIVEFKEEFNLTKHTYLMLVKQPRAFYLAGTEMNWGVFLRDAYREDGTLIEKDPQVVFYERLRKYALMKEEESLDGKVGKIILKK